MSWLTKQRVAELFLKDPYYAPSRWRFYEQVIRFLKEKKYSSETRFLEIGVRSAAMNTQSTVVECDIRPELLEGHRGFLLEGHCDVVMETEALRSKSFDVTIACQCFEHIADPKAAWTLIKRVTCHAALITIPWRWPNNAVHNRDMRDLAFWTHGDAPDELLRIGCRMLAWYTF